MATIYNSDLTKELIEAAKIQTSRDSVPTQIADKVIPVMEVNPKMFKTSNIVRSLLVSDSLTGTIYTAPTDRDFYITAASLTLLTDATGAAGECSIRVIIEGTTRWILTCHNSKGTVAGAGGGSNSISFPTPIKVDRGSIITVNPNSATAAVRGYGTLIGYTVDNFLM